jgi:hypothetical protein
MYPTELFRYYSNNDIYAAVGSSVYNAIWGVVTWNENLPILSINRVEQISIDNLNSSTTLDQNIVKGINEEIFKTSPLLLKGFQNYRGFSCFIDSILYPLLTVDGYFKDRLSKDSPRCPEISEAIKSIDFNKENVTCSLLIEKMKKCEPIKDLATGEQQDDSEFLIALMDIYNLEPTVVRSKIYLSNDKENWFEISDRKEPQTVIEISLGKPGENLLDLYHNLEFEDYTQDVDNKPKYEKTGEAMSYKYTVNRIIDSEVLIFHIKRRFQNKKDKTPITISQTLKDNAKNIYYRLSVVTIHIGGSSGGHYISFFKLEGIWYLYDDLEGVSVTDWENVNKIAKTDCSLLVYYPEKILE